MTTRDMRQCNECAKSKPLNGFRVAMKRRKSYRLMVCRDCEVAYYRSSHRRTLAAAAENKRRDCGFLKQKERIKSALRRKRYPEKARAKEIVNEAISAGRIVRPKSCEKCNLSPAPKRNGASRIHAHHSDHAYPVDTYKPPC